MKYLIETIGMLITFPFMAIEAVVKLVLLILCLPISLLVAIFYPLIKNLNIYWVEKVYNYATRWHKGFYTARIFKLWRID